MEPFNVTETLRNIIDAFFVKLLKIEERLYPPRYCHCATHIETKYKNVFSHHSNVYFPVQKKIIERWEKHDVISFSLNLYKI